ncbi:hypothetical protein JOB18_020536 [Solea senegalensis]|uniref:PiggyBac transposable element-derived protein 4 C-terminal zinc-ribbon domain-containing protein n=1 Tax=Solea senegalensis TaxID=28829 RepID=A0AAV6S632_SOLSE|nr:hypothetical protein JOB18_020536 [Solea senegalensis]
MYFSTVLLIFSCVHRYCEKSNVPCFLHTFPYSLTKESSSTLHLSLLQVARPVTTKTRGPLVLTKGTDCPTGSDRKTRRRCHVCHRPVRPLHYCPACTDCMKGISCQ